MKKFKSSNTGINDLCSSLLTEIFLFLKFPFLVHKISLVQKPWKFLLDEMDYIWTVIYKDCIGNLENKKLISKKTFEEKYLLKEELLKNIIVKRGNKEGFLVDFDPPICDRSFYQIINFEDFEKHQFFILPLFRKGIKRIFLKKPFNIFLWSKLKNVSDKRRFIYHLFYPKFEQKDKIMDEYFLFYSKFFYKIRDEELKIYFIKKLLQNLEIYKVRIEETVYIYVFLKHVIKLRRKKAVKTHQNFTKVKNLEKIFNEKNTFYFNVYYREIQ